MKRKDKSVPVQWNCYDSLKFLIPHMDWTVAEEQSIKADGVDAATIDKQTDLDDDYTSPEMDTADDSRMDVHESTIRSPVEIVEEKPTIQSSILLTSPSTRQEPAQTSNQFYFCLPSTSAPTNPVSHPATETLASSHNLVTSVVSAYREEPPLVLSTTVPSPRPNVTLSAGTSHVASTLPSTQLLANNHALNYFLMDVAQQMDKLNDIAQMEMKIEIHKLLLEKLKNSSNLRLSP